MTYAFDTLEFTQRLEQVGVGHEQAVAHAELARDMILVDGATRIDPIDSKTEIDTSRTRAPDHRQDRGDRRRSGGCPRWA